MMKATNVYGRNLAYIDQPQYPPVYHLAPPAAITMNPSDCRIASMVHQIAKEATLPGRPLTARMFVIVMIHG
jgi:hypothetical protein